MLYKKRKYFDNISENVGKVLSKICPYPNAWTMFAIIPAILTSYFLVNQSFLVAASLFALTAVVDFIDGSVARTMKRVSNFGAYLDTVVDRITEFIVLTGLFFVNYPDFILPTKFWVFLFLFGSLMTTYVKAAAYEKKIVNKEVAIEAGYFFPVKELSIEREGSMVIQGSNDATPIILPGSSKDTQDDGSSTDTQKPAADSQKNFYTNLIN